MRALIQRAYGPVESSVAIAEVASPVPASGQLAVRVRCAGINPLDWKLVEGHYKWMSKARPPCGVGFDLAGELLGDEHDAPYPPGTRVAGLIPAFRRPPGAIAEVACVPAHLLVRVPDGVALEQAAALPVAGLSADQMCRMARIDRGARVLVHGAAGGVGHLAVQIARHLGADVTAAGSAASRTFLESLGAQAVVDRASAPTNWGAPFDAVLDCATALAPYDLAVLLAAGGCYVATTPRFPQVIWDTVLNPVRRRKRQVLMLTLDRARLDALMRLLASGALRVAIEKVYPLADAARALADSRAGRVRGKLVVAIDPA
jgi:NADPH:quinone reductase-like Zn-dependent oxidoreductase